MKEDHLDKMDNKDTKKEMIIKREEEKMIEVTEEIEETDNKENIIKMMIAVGKFMMPIIHLMRVRTK